MNFDDYQKQSLKSLAITDRSIAALAHRTLGLTGEAGIVGNAMKKVIRDKAGALDQTDVQILREKLGDVSCTTLRRSRSLRASHSMRSLRQTSKNPRSSKKTAKYNLLQLSL